MRKEGGERMKEEAGGRRRAVSRTWSYWSPTRSLTFSDTISFFLGLTHFGSSLFGFSLGAIATNPPVTGRPSPASPSPASPSPFPSG